MSTGGLSKNRLDRMHDKAAGRNDPMRRDTIFRMASPGTYPIQKAVSEQLLCQGPPGSTRKDASFEDAFSEEGLQRLAGGARDQDA